MSFLGLKEILGLETTEFQEYSPPQRKNENLSVSSLLTVGKVNGVAWSDLIYRELDEEEKSRKPDSSGKEEIQAQDLPLISQSPSKLILSAVNNVGALDLKKVISRDFNNDYIAPTSSSLISNTSLQIAKFNDKNIREIYQVDPSKTELETWQNQLEKEGLRKTKKDLEDKNKASDFEKWKNELHFDIEESLEAFTQEVKLWNEMYGVERKSLRRKLSNAPKSLADNNNEMEKSRSEFSEYMDKQVSTVESQETQMRTSLVTKMREFVVFRKKITQDEKEEEEKLRYIKENRIEFKKRHYPGYNLTPKLNVKTESKLMDDEEERDTIATTSPRSFEKQPLKLDNIRPLPSSPRLNGSTPRDLEKEHVRKLSFDGKIKSRFALREMDSRSDVSEDEASLTDTSHMSDEEYYSFDESDTNKSVNLGKSVS